MRHVRPPVCLPVSQSVNQMLTKFSLHRKRNSIQIEFQIPLTILLMSIRSERATISNNIHL